MSARPTLSKITKLKFIKVIEEKTMQMSSLDKNEADQSTFSAGQEHCASEEIFSNYS